jgi:hypothetical protein
MKILQVGGPFVAPPGFVEPSRVRTEDDPHRRSERRRPGDDLGTYRFGVEPQVLELRWAAGDPGGETPAISHVGQVAPAAEPVVPGHQEPGLRRDRDPRMSVQHRRPERGQPTTKMGRSFTLKNR